MTIDGIILEHILSELNELKVKPILITLIGSRGFGFSKENSDYDVRGVHIQPTSDILSLQKPQDTIEFSFQIEDKETLIVDFASWEIEKVLNAFLKANGNIMEAVYSNLVLFEDRTYTEKLKEIGSLCITKELANFFKGYADGQMRRLTNALGKEKERPLKKALHIYRLLLEGIIAMKTGEIKLNIYENKKSFDLPMLDKILLNKDLIFDEIPTSERDEIFEEIDYLYKELDSAKIESKLSDKFRDIKKLNDFLLDVRLKN